MLFEDFQEINSFVTNLGSTRFSTKKTLNSHIKIVHAPDRLRYPCPWKPCTDNFTSLASTERHLIKGN